MGSDSKASLLEFIRKSPSVYHVIDNLTARLRAAGYEALDCRRRWALRPGGKYYVTRGGASVIALRIPETEDWSGFRISAAHSDSPGFRLKYNWEVSGNGYLRLNTEPYGGMIMASWLDRPLSVAGRVLVQEGGRLEARLVNIDRDLLVIPSVAIHMDRSCNDGRKLLANVDLLPLLGEDRAAGSLRSMVADAAGVSPKSIADGDLYVYCRTPGTTLGAEEAYLLSPRLDDLECAWGCMEGFLQGGERADTDAVSVCCVFHNEEVGSATKQGAGSSLLRDILRRVCLAAGKDEQDLQALLAGSFLVSADNAHAIHPNHPEYADGQNSPRMNGGIVIKYNANQRYATDGVSAAVFRSICDAAGVPVQVYANRSDLPGGSTLGSIADTLLPVSTVDIGLAQLAMHAAVETAGAEDPAYLQKAMTAYYTGALPALEQ